MSDGSMSASRLVRSTDLHVSTSHLELTWSFVSCCHSWHGSHSFHLEPCGLDLREWKYLWWLSILYFLLFLLVTKSWLFVAPWTAARQAFLSPGACSNSCPSSQWCHPTISSFVAPFSCPQSFPASGSFPVSRLFTSGGQNIGASASATVVSMNIQGWFPLGLTGLISLVSKALSKVFSSTTVQKHQFFGT